ncbi:MAG TPA: hypothetical protein VGL71_02960 [Urbifossiella sp.]|jgi:hypothetical protein
MAIPTLIAAILLISVGITGYANQNPEKMSWTALIPAIFGLALAICGLLAFNDRLRKHAMHAASVIALLGGLGAPYPVIKRLVKGTEVNFSEPAVISATLTTAICFALLALCVNSFIQAKKARRAAANPPA